MKEDYVSLKDLQVYCSAVDLSNESWKIYQEFDWHDQKIIGDQFITSVDSVGANIAEGYGRFHYLDRIKFYYNARGSLLEAKHWILLLRNRNKISLPISENFFQQLNNLHYQLNSFIKSCYPKK